MTAADYAHDQRSGNSQGLHYSTFEPPSKKRAHARSTSCSKKIFPRCANPPSWASPSGLPPEPVPVLQPAAGTPARSTARSHPASNPGTRPELFDLEAQEEDSND